MIKLECGFTETENQKKKKRYEVVLKLKSRDLGTVYSLASGLCAIIKNTAKNTRQPVLCILASVKICSCCVWLSESLNQETAAHYSAFSNNCLTGKSFTLKVCNSTKAFTSSEPPLCLQSRVDTPLLCQTEICTVTYYYHAIHYYPKVYMTEKLVLQHLHNVSHICVSEVYFLQCS